MSLEISTISGKDPQRFNNSMFCRCTECQQSCATRSTCCSTGFFFNFL